MSLNIVRCLCGDSPALSLIEPGCVSMSRGAATSVLGLLPKQLVLLLFGETDAAAARLIVRNSVL